MPPRNHPNDDRTSFQRKQDEASDELQDFITSPKGVVFVAIFIVGGAVAVGVAIIKAIIGLF